MQFSHRTLKLHEVFGHLTTSRGRLLHTETCVWKWEELQGRDATEVQRRNTCYFASQNCFIAVAEHVFISHLSYEIYRRPSVTEDPPKQSAPTQCDSHHGTQAPDERHPHHRG